MKKVIVVTCLYCVAVLWYVFGAATTVNTTSPEYASNIVRRVLREPVIQIGPTNTNSPTSIIFNSGVLGNNPVSSFNFTAKDSNGVVTTVASITVTKVAGWTNAVEIKFLAMQTNLFSFLLSPPITISTNGAVILYKLNPLAINFPGNANYLPFPQSTGAIGSTLAIGTNELYWKP